MCDLSVSRHRESGLFLVKLSQFNRMITAVLTQCQAYEFSLQVEIFAGLEASEQFRDFLERLQRVPGGLISSEMETVSDWAFQW